MYQMNKISDYIRDMMYFDAKQAYDLIQHLNNKTNMKEVKIEVPKGYEIDKEKSTFEKIVFKEIKKEIAWEDFGNIEGFFIDSYSVIRRIEYEKSRFSNKNTFPTKEEAKACLALAQLCQWRDKYNEGWKPDYNKGWGFNYSNTYFKYSLYFHKGCIYKGMQVHDSAVLTFKTEEIRDKFLEDFRELIEIAKPLL